MYTTIFNGEAPEGKLITFCIRSEDEPKAIKHLELYRTSEHGYEINNYSEEEIIDLLLFVHECGVNGEPFKIARKKL